jgi:actin-related protein
MMMRVVLTAEKIDTTQSSLLITEPYFNLPNIQDVYDQMIFEEYEFAAYYRSTRKFYCIRQLKALI